ncbi:MAG: hypothetical protein JHC95_14580 [Solirubrobacteraceae bacterium]|nr:hypothetical protein [Solirubrobacteraceae bacterium]
MRTARIALVALLATAAPASAADNSQLEPRNAAAAREVKRDAQAAEIFGKALERVAEKQCRIKDADGSTTKAPPSQALLDLIGVLRQPYAGAEPAVPPLLIGPPVFTFDGMRPEAARRVALPDGRSVALLPVADVVDEPLTPPGCRRALVQSVRREARSATAGVRRRAIRVAQEIRLESKPSAPVEGVAAAVLDGDGYPMEFMAGPLAEIRDEGIGVIYHVGKRRYIVGIAPDGVASVQFTFSRVVDYGRLYKPHRYPSAETMTAPVKDNVFAVSASTKRSRMDGWPSRSAFLDTDGREIRASEFSNPG